ncbi:uncharacterized protein [Panulirus ornatus]|uniref:uncharacterized protein isoform X2 n=1 Tax=Panulirus ornatus TaxID=150431 RepID=UPI003A877629
MIPLHQRHSKWQSVGRYHFGDLVPQPMDELVTKTCITNVTMETLNSQEHRSRGTNAVPRVIHLIFQTIIEVRTMVIQRFIRRIWPGVRWRYGVRKNEEVKVLASEEMNLQICREEYERGPVGQDSSRPGVL